MSIDYAAGLSHYDDLGKCGGQELLDNTEIWQKKVSVLADWIRESSGSCIIHAGAGLSTAAGIRDFRGKNGVWTEMITKTGLVEDKNHEHRDKKMKTEIKSEVKPFDETEPTYSHMALKVLCQKGFIRHIVSQNVDGLFLKSGLSRSFISELHGNFYLDECTCCKSRFIRSTASKSMRLQKSDIKCPRNSDSSCKGYLRDTILDWESPIPHNELRVATRESKLSSLHICIGTSMQLSPSKDLICKPSGAKSKGLQKKLAIINLQETNFDSKANLVIHYYADDVMKELMRLLNLNVSSYDPSQDPTKSCDRKGTRWLK